MRPLHTVALTKYIDQAAERANKQRARYGRQMAEQQHQSGPILKSRHAGVRRLVQKHSEAKQITALPALDDKRLVIGGALLFAATPSDPALKVCYYDNRYRHCLLLLPFQRLCAKSLRWVCVVN